MTGIIPSNRAINGATRQTTRGIPVQEVKDGRKVADPLRESEATHGERIRLKEDLHMARSPSNPLSH